MSSERHDDTDERREATSSTGGEQTFSIGQLADEFDITTRTIRFYEARGLISPLRSGTTRVYARRDRARLALILRGKNLGFTLEDIAEYLALYDVDPTQRVQTEVLIGKVDAAIADLNRKRADLDRSLRDLKDIRAKCAEFLGSVDGTSNGGAGGSEQLTSSSGRGPRREPASPPKSRGR